MTFWKRSQPGTIGQEKERQAEAFLQRQGLQPVSRNYRCKAGEIDLIMRDGEYLVFVEVRYRRNNRHGSAAETIDWRKQQKVMTTAEFFLQQNNLYDQQACRFDAVCFNGTDSLDTCHWIKDVFAN